MQGIEKFQETFLRHLDNKLGIKQPYSLYQPINYIMKLGGKRLRPVLTLMAADVFDTDYHSALDAALAVEVFHNFTLVHDDIMDEAPLRRGQETVHNKWDVNTGILSGDAMLIMAYKLFETYDPDIFHALITTFNKTALEVCEGQQYDIDFENRNDVTIPDYVKMIELKTAVLVAAALKMGAIIAQTSKANQEKIYDFGRYLGIAFQIQDDYLDAFGNPETFGKQLGGDIIANKKTLLYLKTLELASSDQKNTLLKLYTSASIDDGSKVEEVMRIFKASGASDAVKKEIEKYSLMAFESLDEMDVPKEKKDNLRTFGHWLMTRSS